ncbi:MAG: RloB family protein [Endomicrobium sp.]|uniref:RloB domain-containing protein n=1 Tax=Candidatus Endomicrobiellum pyrsonymphae TaxID=1408203 RepID=UPI0035848D92|nr:RloB family protein [Endomicrobium sp.]
MSNLNSGYIIIIICEGKSEVAYIQELNKYFREKNISINLVSKQADNGSYAAVVKKYKEFKKNNKHGFRMWIWVDRDIYKRNERKNMDKYNKKPDGVPNFCFNIFNFEDFFILHYPKDKVSNYRKLCENKDHFKNPLHSEDYMPLIKKVIEGYNKGSLPNGFEISAKTLNNLFTNNKDLQKELQNDFANELYNIINN